MARKLLLLLLLSFWISPVWATDYCADATCAACWLFKEGSGTTVDDSSANSNTGTFKGDGEPAWASMSGTNAPSYSAYLVNFDGTNDYIDAGSNATIDNIFDTSPGGSIVAWTNPDDYGETFSGFTAGQIFYKRTSGNGWLFRCDQNARLHFAVEGVTTDGTQSTDNNSYVLDVWQHTALTYYHNSADATTTATIYIDGVSVNVTSVNWSGFAADAVQTLYLGAFGTTGNQDWDGFLTEMAMFKAKILSSTEINDIMDNGLIPTAARRMWLF